MQVIQKIVRSFANGKAALIAVIKNKHHSRRQKFSTSALAIPVSALVALMGAINCHFHLVIQHQRVDEANVFYLSRQYKRVNTNGNDDLNNLPIFAPQHKTKMGHAAENREHSE